MSIKANQIARTRSAGLRGRSIAGWAIARPEAEIVLVLLLLCLALSLRTSAFLTTDNLFGIVRSYSNIALSALGITLVLLVGGIDLSVGAIMAFAGLVCAAALTYWGLSTPLAVLVGVLGGGLIGLMNAFLIVRLKLQPFIATLGMLWVTRGIIIGSARGQVGGSLPDSFTALGQGHLGPMPVPALIVLIVAVVIGLFLKYHAWGASIYAIGSNEASALLAGLPVNNIKVFVYLCSGLLSGLAGVLMVSRLGVSAPAQTVGYELNVIAAVMIGGVSLRGGRGTIPGVVLGAIIIGVLYNAFVMLKIDTYWQQTFIGGIIILAGLADFLRQRRA
jgi:ribose transport system permease protein